MSREYYTISTLFADNTAVVSGGKPHDSQKHGVSSPIKTLVFRRENGETIIFPDVNIEEFSNIVFNNKFLELLFSDKLTPKYKEEAKRPLVRNTPYTVRSLNNLNKRDLQNLLSKKIPNVSVDLIDIEKNDQGRMNAYAIINYLTMNDNYPTDYERSLKLSGKK